MSAKVAAAILTRVYFDKIAVGPLPSEKSGLDLTNIDRIGTVYAAFLGRHKLFENMASHYFVPEREEPDTDVFHPRKAG